MVVSSIELRLDCSRQNLVRAMKEIAENRDRVHLAGKLRVAKLALRENGLGWAVLFALYWVSSTIANWSFGAMSRQRAVRGNPGLNSVALNKAIWDEWNWNAGGEEWTPSSDWKTSVVKAILEPYAPHQGRVLEIGPGGGRWTEFLIPRASSYIGIDVSKSAVESCRRRFASIPKAEFVVGSGTDLSAADDNSIDFIWSFDVFVHINEREVGAYLAEIRRVLKPGGLAVIHHGTVGGSLGGWRSDLTQEAMVLRVAQTGLTHVTSFTDWTYNGATFRLDTYNDRVTIVRRTDHL